MDSSISKALAEALLKPVPKPFAIESPGFLVQFEKVLDETADRVFNTRWRSTIKVGGKLFEDIRSKNPQNTDIISMCSILDKYKQKLISGFQVPKSEKKEGGDLFEEVTSQELAAVGQGSWEEKGKEREKEKKAKEDEAKEKIKEKELVFKEKMRGAEERARLYKRDLVERGMDEGVADNLKKVFFDEEGGRIQKEFFAESLQLLSPVPAEPPASVASSRPPAEFSKVGVVAREVTDVLGLTAFEERENFLVEKFWNFEEHNFEAATLFPGRKRFWGWMVASLEASPLKLKHLVAQADKYDVAHLFILIKKFLATENPHTLCEKIDAFFYCEPSQGEDIFTFYARLKEKIKEIERLDHVAKNVGASIEIPNIFIVNKLLKAATRSGQYKPFIEQLQLSPMEDWMKKTPDEFISQLQRVHISTTQLSQNFSPPSANFGRSHTREGGAPREGRSKSRGPPAGCPEGVCYDFFLKGACARDSNCRFSHPQQYKGKGGPRGATGFQKGGPQGEADSGKGFPQRGPQGEAGFGKGGASRGGDFKGGENKNFSGPQKAFSPRPQTPSRTPDARPPHAHTQKNTPKDTPRPQVSHPSSAGKGGAFCTRCKRPGHIADVCYSPLCKKCGRVGHTGDTCRSTAVSMHLPRHPRSHQAFGEEENVFSPLAPEGGENFEGAENFQGQDFYSQGFSQESEVESSPFAGNQSE
jgi:hypothetical protein